MRAFIRTVFVACLLLGLFTAIAGLANPASATAAGSAAEIYVLNFMHDSVLIYNGNSNGDVRPIRTIEGDATGINGATCVAFDTQGNLYVLNTGGFGSITVYPPGANGNAHPIRTITGDNTGLKSGAGCLAVDGKGSVYVTDSYGTQEGNGPTVEVDSVLVYPPGASGDVKPIRTIKGRATHMDHVHGLALDKAGNLYVANGGGQVNRRDANMRVTVYAPGADGNAAPIRAIEGPDTGLDASFFLALDAKGSIYVGNSAISTGVPATAGIVTTTVYAPGASGNARPARTLRASVQSAGTFGNALALDGAGDIYMNDMDGGAVVVYSPGAGGGAPPVRTIKGLNTQLNNPRFVAVWPLGPAAPATGGETIPPNPGVAGGPPNQPAQSGGHVTAVRRVGVRPSPDYKGRYPAQFEFVFSITTDGPAEVKYVLVNQADRAWNSGALNFAGAATKEVVVPVKVGVPPGKHFEGWAKLEVYVPNKLDSEEVPITADTTQ